MKGIFLRRERLILCCCLCILGVCMLTAALCREARAMFSMTGVKIVLDAGHGGWDPGKIGTHGENEKMLNLAVVERLTEYLEQGGAEVILTRNADAALGRTKKTDMAERQRIANQTGAEILVSIHQNAFPSAKARGAQVFYHKSSEKGRVLAECVQESLRARLDGNNARMAKENQEYYILRTTQIPAVIVECGFLSNAEEERLLNDTAYQERLAWAVYCGILDYFEKISII